MVATADDARPGTTTDRAARRLRHPAEPGFAGVAW
jgi:hypothetical protein